MPTCDHVSRRAFIAGSMAAGALRSAAWAEDAPPPPATAPSERFPIGCYTRPWADLDYRAALDAIAEAGFRYCGLMTAKGGLVLSAESTLDQADAVGEQVRRRSLRILSTYGGSIPLESVDQAVRGLRRLIDNCAAAGSANLLMGGVGEEKDYPVYYKAIAECCAYAGEKRLSISIKPHGGLNATGTQVRKAVEQVNHRNFRIWYDAGNIYYYSDGKLDPVMDAATVGGLVTGWCIKDYLPPRNVDVTPGDGRVDFAKVFAALRKGGFDRGPLVIETLAPGDAPKRLAEAARARLYVERMVERVRGPHATP